MNESMKVTVTDIAAENDNFKQATVALNGETPDVRPCVYIKEVVNDVTITIGIAIEGDADKDSLTEIIKRSIGNQINKLSGANIDKLIRPLSLTTDNTQIDYTDLKVQLQSIALEGYDKALIDPVNKDPEEMKKLSLLFNKGIYGEPVDQFAGMPSGDLNPDDNTQTGEC